MKTALITGITGQDGAYLAKLLLEKGYRVVGAYRRSSTHNTWRLEVLGIKDKIEFISMELLEYESIARAIEYVYPDEVYNLAAQTFVQESFLTPIYTAEINAIGVARLLEAISKIKPDAKFYQASTSEMYGKVQETPQSETTPFYPRSPYGVAKLYAHWLTINYRESHNLFTCCGILFNHESPLRGSEFVTRKITLGLAGIKEGRAGPVLLGNLNAKRDWGYAEDYVLGMWLMLQQEAPSDYVLASGRSYSIRDFCNLAARAYKMALFWHGNGEEEHATDMSGKTVIAVSSDYYRPAEVDLLLGDARKAYNNLGWDAHTTLPQLVELMVQADWERAKHAAA
jgi:GDPmannose 4,6-dehydratase